MELRGGVEDYLAAAAKVLRSDGLVVVCADGRRPERVIEGAERAGLRPLRRRDIMPRSDAQTPLLSVWSLTNSPDPTTELEHLTLLIRDQDGHQTKEARGLRAFFGLPL